jgi:proteasome lid subunit RPN8/RPN11
MITVKIKSTKKKYSINVKDESYLVFDLTSYLTNSLVKKIYISHSVIEEINEWVLLSLDVEYSSSVKEVGGFLFGKYESIDNKHFIISIDYFYPAKNVKSSSPYRISFGKGIFLEIDDFLKNNESQCLIGWFHTHPGWTPYLSETDLVQMHNVIFTNAYQIAVVLDSKTLNFDTGIFTKKNNLSMNNSQDYKSWIQWKNLLQNEIKTDF